MVALKRSTPGDQGIRAAGIAAFVRAAEDRGIALHSIMVARHGAVVAEGWWAPYGPEHRQMMFSVSKSVTATAIGIAQDEGLLSVDDFVMDFFPSLGSPSNRENMQDVRVRHLLAMATGHDVDTMEIMRALPHEDWVRIFMGVPVVFPPGSHFLYNSGASYVLSAIVTARTGKSPREYLRDRLWRPLGVDDPPWESSPGGLNFGASGLRLTTEELLKLGMLYLQRGSWGSERVLSEDWVETATSVQVANGSGPDDDWSAGYGFQIWRSLHESYRFDGRYGQFAFVLPEYDAVVAITAGTDEGRSVPPLLWEHLLPAFQDAPLRSELEAEADLRSLLGSRVVRVPEFLPQAEVLPERKSIVIDLPFNTLHVSRAEVAFSGEDVEVTLRTLEGHVETLRASRGAWRIGRTEIWPYEEMNAVTGFAVGGFTRPDRLEVHQQLVDTPFRRTWAFEFLGDAEVKVSVGLDNGFWVDRTEVLDGQVVR